MGPAARERGGAAADGPREAADKGVGRSGETEDADGAEAEAPAAAPTPKCLVKKSTLPRI